MNAGIVDEAKGVGCDNHQLLMVYANLLILYHEHKQLGIMKSDNESEI